MHVVVLDFNQIIYSFFFLRAGRRFQVASQPFCLAVSDERGFRVIKPSDLMTLVKNASRANLNRQFFFIILKESSARFAEVLAAP